MANLTEAADAAKLALLRKIADMAAGTRDPSTIHHLADAYAAVLGFDRSPTPATSRPTRQVD
ncbi:hypothetical protein Lfu02_32620 [Longispora fulva]|uniref:Uncharacterized protein n=1 Tax=Longispora fulva TaxID=619741 RepID=A0A8J7KSA0_9ACTN|nr:hypothetical protein [Longispora fulva]MBG6139392.1 hypothetical protein [Longispora fulva]GIG58890.1 hypothetical protein Lfu02_32620 [Longispora fulva]